jgi:hypothetical protein
MPNSGSISGRTRVLTDGAANYAGRLRKRLEESGVEILPVPGFPHKDLVQRATERRRPCNDKGDGYRDTLNWLTLLDFAKAEPDHRIIWVSNNTDDFGSGGGELHPDLIGTWILSRHAIAYLGRRPSRMSS